VRAHARMLVSFK